MFIRGLTPSVLALWVPGQETLSPNKQTKLTAFFPSFLVLHRIIQFITTGILGLIKCGAIKRFVLGYFIVIVMSEFYKFVFMLLRKFVTKKS